MTRRPVNFARFVVKPAHAAASVDYPGRPHHQGRLGAWSRKSEAYSYNSLVVMHYIPERGAVDQATRWPRDDTTGTRLAHDEQGCKVDAIARRSEPPQSSHAASLVGISKTLAQEVLHMGAQQATPRRESSCPGQKTFTRRGADTVGSHLSCISTRGVLPLTNGAADASR